jgi:DNA-binding transcriptional ArsR family regulator
MGELSGDQLIEVLATLASPHRLRVLAALTGGRAYVSQLARGPRDGGNTCVQIGSCGPGV